MKKISKRKDPAGWYKENRERVLEERKAHYRKNREKTLAKHKEYHRSYRGYAQYLYRSMQTRIKFDKTYKNVKIDFSKEEFLQFLEEKNYKELHTQWVDNDFNFLFSPSVDRIDSRKGYSLDNIQIMTISQNATKSNSDRRKCPHCLKTW